MRDEYPGSLTGSRRRVPLPAFVNNPFGCCDAVPATMHWMFSDAGRFPAAMQAHRESRWPKVLL
jgi:hypothetical protein